MQRSLNRVYRTGVHSAKGKRLGRVLSVLFELERPVVVGYIVERPRFLWLYDRKDRYLAHDRIKFTDEGIEIVEERGAWDRKAATRLGIDWENTVVWSGMPVRTEGGIEVGVVRDGLFDEGTGELRGLGLSGGTTADLALGTTDLPARMVIGFADGCIVISDEALALEPSGGAAAAAGKGAAVARAQAEEAAIAAAKVAKTEIGRAHV